MQFENTERGDLSNTLSSCLVQVSAFVGSTSFGFALLVTLMVIYPNTAQNKATLCCYSSVVMRLCLDHSRVGL